jgi:hypothetical protein
VFLLPLIEAARKRKGRNKARLTKEGEEEEEEEREQGFLLLQGHYLELDSRPLQQQLKLKAASSNNSSGIP